MKKTILFLLIILALFSLVGCGKDKPLKPANFDISGSWEYTMTTEGSEDIYDSGTITFTGTPEAGEYTLLNIYEVEYTGTYKVTKISIMLSGDTEVQGSFVDANHIIGTWGDDATNGRWTAVRLTE